MGDSIWGEADLKRIAAHGLTLAEVERQLALLRAPPPAARLLRPATPGDGIRVLPEEQAESYHDAWREAAAAGRITWFVPASGAATRMFRALLAARDSGAALTQAALARRAAEGDREAAELLVFVDGLPRFAFFTDLRATAAARGLDVAAGSEHGDCALLIDALLAPQGLDYAAKAKGLLEFHRYPGGSRTAFEEQLGEAARVVRDARGTARLHLTVSPQHRAAFEALLEAVRPVVERRAGARFAVGFSEQSSATDTVALGDDGLPCHEPDGSLLFRPGGHGSLIRNLANLGADLLLVKNIDNIVPDHRRAPCVRWKRVLAGLLVTLERQARAALDALDGDPPAPAAIAAALDLLARELDVPVPESIGRASSETRAAFARRKLERPLRVCGMVRATDDPGGGPFWVAGPGGEASLQIVETAQVDQRDPGQRSVLAAATHFNPVDLACAVRDRHGRPFDLRRHVDPNAAFVAEKSSGGRRLRALEHPGLWNGAMGDWTTVFVEVPLATFNPVKTVNDLLRPEHQPPPGC